MTSTNLILRFGPLVGMGKHCPIRKFGRRALIALLAAATLCGAVAAANHARETAAQLGEAQTDRENLIAHLNGASFYEDKPNGARVYTHAETHEIAVRPLMVGIK